MTFEFPGKGKVSVLKTKPETVLNDIGELMKLAGYQSALQQELATILKIDMSRESWFPACSSSPWQIEGVVRQLQHDGYERLIAGHHRIGNIDAYAGERNNKHKYVVDKYGVENVHLYEPHVEWIIYEPKAEMMVLHDIYPEGIQIPRMFIGKNIVHLPVLRTHALTSIAGALKNAFGGLLSHRQRWTRPVLHETLVDLLSIQREIHPGLFAVMDGTFAGNGTGAPGLHVCEKDLLLASADQVAIDAVSARLQGFDPMDIDFIRLAHEKGLGIGDPEEIEIVGYDMSLEEAWNSGRERTVASTGPKLTSMGSLKQFEEPLLRSPIGDVAEYASYLYENVFWQPIVGRPRVKEALKTRWGKLFKSYDDGKVALPGPEPKATLVAALLVSIVFTMLGFVIGRLFRR